MANIDLTLDEKLLFRLQEHALDDGGYVSILLKGRNGSGFEYKWDPSLEYPLEIHPSDPHLARIFIGLTPRQLIDGKATVTRSRYLQIDIDTIRPKLRPATDYERTLAFMVADRIRNDLADRKYGWAGMIDSGNGVRLLLRVEDVLPPDTETFFAKAKEWTRRIAAAYNNPSVKIDLGGCNPLAYLPFPGILNRKGVETPDRPYRPARVIFFDDAPPSANLREKINSIKVEPPPNQQRNEALQQLPSNPALMEKCPLVKFLIDQAVQHKYLTHQGRLIVGTLGKSLGPNGLEWADQIIRHTTNYNPRTTAQHLKSLADAPYRCTTIHRLLQETHGDNTPPMCQECRGTNRTPAIKAREINQ